MLHALVVLDVSPRGREERSSRGGRGSGEGRGVANAVGHVVTEAYVDLGQPRGTCGEDGENGTVNMASGRWMW